MAASATLALKAGVWFGRGRLFIVSPDSLAQRARCQAETPLIVLFRFLRPALLQHVTPALFGEPKGNQPPPWWIRGILILTCTLVSFFHGSNDGQKGMGLIILILIGTAPTAYALNRALPDSQIKQFIVTSTAAS